MTTMLMSQVTHHLRYVYQYILNLRCLFDSGIFFISSIISKCSFEMYLNAAYSMVLIKITLNYVELKMKFQRLMFSTTVYLATISLFSRTRRLTIFVGCRTETSANIKQDQNKNNAIMYAVWLYLSVFDY